MGEIKQAKIVLKGKVQGVFLRDFAKQNANKMGLVGYIKNLNNGNVLIRVRGNEKLIDDFSRLCRRGPMMAKIDDLSIVWEDMDPEEEFEGFDIRYL